MRQERLRQTAVASLLGLAILATPSTGAFCRTRADQACCQKNYQGNNLTYSLEGSHKCCKQSGSHQMPTTLALESTTVGFDLDKGTSLTRTEFLPNRDMVLGQHLFRTASALDHQSPSTHSGPVITCALLI